MYGFDEASPKYMKNYLSNQKQKVKIRRVKLEKCPTRFNLRPILFKIFLCDLFLFLPNIDIANYADDCTPYTINKSTRKVLRDIKITSEKPFFLISE